MMDGGDWNKVETTYLNIGFSARVRGGGRSVSLQQHTQRIDLLSFLLRAQTCIYLTITYLTYIMLAFITDLIVGLTLVRAQLRTSTNITIGTLPTFSTCQPALINWSGGSGTFFKPVL